MKHKNVENLARASRHQAEAQVLRHIKFEPLEGSETHKVGDLKFTVSARMSRKLDPERWAEIEPKIPENLRAVVETRPVLVTAGVRYLMANEPETWAVIAEAVTSTPQKPQIKITEIEEE
jgi:hypothetical protein